VGVGVGGQKYRMPSTSELRSLYRALIRHGNSFPQYNIKE
jgi:hypothetical protein